KIIAHSPPREFLPRPGYATGDGLSIGLTGWGERHDFAAFGGRSVTVKCGPPAGRRGAAARGAGGGAGAVRGAVAAGVGRDPDRDERLAGAAPDGDVPADRGRVGRAAGGDAGAHAGGAGAGLAG